MSRRDPLVALRQMRDHAAEAVALLARRKRRDLDTNRVLMLALTRLVEIVSEAANRVSSDLQVKYAQIPWPDVIGMRHRLVHGYDEVDLDVLWATVQEDLPGLLKQLDRILEA